MQKINFTYKQKLELAKWIAKNNGGAITGSIMLRERGIELGREPNDIDIIISSELYPEDIELPPLCSDEVFENNDDGYEVLKRCYYFGLKIEFIVDDEELQNSNKIRFLELYNYATVDGLLKAKLKYVQEDSNKEYITKTKRDIEIIKKHIETKQIIW